MPVKERERAIDFVKFIAVFLVMNSHMGMCYPRYQFLATGGAIGDALFFFVSGFTLFLGSGEGKSVRFDEWYKRRIRRIYPSLLSVAIIGTFLFGQEEAFGDIIIAKRYWFIQCIFALYPILYLAKKFVTRHILLLVVLTTVVIAAFPVVYKDDALFYGRGYYRWVVYLLFMLLGGIVGKERDRIKQMSVWLAFALFIVCVAAWYGLVYLFGHSYLQVLSIIPLMGIAIATYCVGKSKLVSKLLHSRIIGSLIISIGALCLECYLIQKMIFTDAWNSFFPWNILIIMALVLIASYFVKILANLIGQILDSKPLNWHNVLRIYQ